MSDRRAFLKICAAAILGGGLNVSSDAQLPDDFVTEQQQGDPDGTIEYVTYSPSMINHEVTKSGKAVFEKWKPEVPISMLSVARGFIGVTRNANPDKIASFLALFDLPPQNQKGNIAFCAAGLSYCALKSYTDALHGPSTERARTESLKQLMPDVEHYYFYPTVSCNDMYHIAAGKRHWIDHKQKPTVIPSPGWIVLYDWHQKGLADHCGVVQSASQDQLITVEFNTSKGKGNQRMGGVVAEKCRTYDCVLGFVKTDVKHF
jgi:hypothetical protein